MGLPQLLLGDASESVLQFQTEALRDRCAVVTARDGAEALEQARRSRPDVIVLALSLPGLSGAKVLEVLRRDATFAHVPILLVSAEPERREALLAAGAAAVLEPSLDADAFLAAVERAVAAGRSLASARGLTALLLRVGDVLLGFPLTHVRAVILQPATAALPGSPSYLSRSFLYQGEPCGILDLADRLGLSHAVPLIERRLILFDRAVLPFAVQADTVEDPFEFAAGDLRAPEALGLQAGGQLLLALARLPPGAGTDVVPILDPEALASPAMLRDLPGLLRDVPRLSPSRSPAALPAAVDPWA